MNDSLSFNRTIGQDTRNTTISGYTIDGVANVFNGSRNLTRVSGADLCMDVKMPDVASYISGLSFYASIIFTFGCIAVVVVFLIYLDTLKYVIKNAPGRVKAKEVFLISIYPVVGVTTFLALVVPRSQLLVERVTQGMFDFGLYQLFCLYIEYCGGESQLIRQAEPSSLNPRVGPCCCFPCCILPVLTVNKRNLMVLRILMIQLPIIQCFAYLGFLAMWAEEESLYLINYTCLQVIVEMSILVATWSILITINMLKNDLRLHAIEGKFMTMQIPFLLCKMQWGIPALLIHFGVMPCFLPLTEIVFGNIMFNAAMLLETIGFGWWARKLYKKDFSQEDNATSPPAIVEVASNVNEDTEQPSSLTITKSQLNLFCYDNLVVVKL